MTRPVHAAHRMRVVTRCERCRTPLLRGCGYRSCAAVERPTRAQGRDHELRCAGLGGTLRYRSRKAATVDLVAAAREIFADLIVQPSLGLE